MQTYQYTINIDEINLVQLCDEIYSGINKRLYKQYSFESADGYINIVNQNIENNLEICLNDSLDAGELTALNGLITGHISDSNYITSVGELTTAELSSDTNNYNISGLNECNLLKVRSSKKISISGITAPVHNQHLRILNVGRHNITFKMNDSNSLAINRILFNDNIILQPNQSITFVYDKKLSRWTC